MWNQIGWSRPPTINEIKFFDWGEPDEPHSSKKLTAD